MTKEINMEEIKFADDEVFKVFIRPAKNRPLSATMWRNLLENVHRGKVIPVPDGLEFIVIKKDGSVKVY